MQRGQSAKMGGGMQFTRAVPNFLGMMAGPSGQAPDVGGIEGALQRERERGAKEPEDREDNDEEAPVVVDAAEALTEKERRKLGKMSGSLSFKGDDTAPAAKFRESAHSRVAEAEEQRRQKAAEQAAADEAAAAESGKVVFRPGAAAAERKAAEPKPGKAGKRKLGGGADGSKVGAKALKNTKLLSFAEDEV